MSETFTSAWHTPNELLAPMAAYDTHRNALLTEQHNQQVIGSTDMEMVARAASPLLGMSETDAAAAYPGLIAGLKAQGFAKYAPDQYPGHAVTQHLVSLGIPAEKQWERAGNQATIGSMYTPPSGDGSTAPAPGGGGGGYAPSGQAPLTPFRASNLPQGVTPAEDQLVRTVIGEAGGEPLAGQQAVAHVVRNRARIGNQDTESVIFAPNQFEPWNNAATRAKLEAIDPTSPQYQQILNTVVRPVFAGQAADPTGGATHFYSPTAQAALGRPPPSWSQGGNRTTIGRHDFFYPGYSAPQQTAGGTQPAVPGTATTGTTAPATPAPAPGRVAIGDSLAVGVGPAGGMITFAKERASPAAIAARIQSDEVPALNGKDVVLSTGASNNPADFASIEQQLRTLQGKGAGKITVLGVGDRPDLAGVNDKLAALAKQYGADFQPIDPANLSADRVHPRDYTKVVPGGAPAAPGTPAPYQVATTGNTVPPPPGGAPGASVAPAPGASAPAPPGAAAAPTAPALPPPPQFQSNGFTVAQNRVLQALQRSNVTPAQFTAQMNAYTDDNRAAVTQYQTEVNRIETNRRADAAAALAQDAAKRDAEKLQLEKDAAKRAGLPTGYKLDESGTKAVRIDGLPPDPAVQDALDKARAAAQPFQGTSEDAQNRNTLLKGDPKSPEYHSAYASYADPKVQEGGLIVKHNMQPYRMPQDDEGNPITTYDQPNISIGPGDLPKLRAFETGAAALKSALDDFASTSRKASTGEWVATLAGQPTDLSSAWTNAALLAKGTALFDLGVLSGPDMAVIRGALADPSTFRGSVASNATIDKQVARIKQVLDTRLDQARRSYGGGMSTGGAAATPAPATPVEPPTKVINLDANGKIIK